MAAELHNVVIESGTTTIDTTKLHAQSYGSRTVTYSSHKIYRAQDPLLLSSASDVKFQFRIRARILSVLEDYPQSYYLVDGLWVDSDLVWV